MKKRILSVLVVSALMLMPYAAAKAGSARIEAGKTVVVNNPYPGDRLNLRVRPDESSPTLGKYYNGTFLKALSDEKDGWVRVRIFNVGGYMKAKFLVYPEQLQIGAASVPAVKIQNSGGSGLNLRVAQSLQSASLGLYKNGSTVRVFGVSETWAHVQTEDGNVGFVLRKRLSPEPEFNKSGSAAFNGGAVVNNPNPADRLNLRCSPDKSAPTLGKYYNGTDVDVLSGDKNGWTMVSVYGLEGYMMTKFLAFGQDKFSVFYAIPDVQIRNMNGTGLNLREGRSTSSALLGFYGNGSTVSVLGVSESWCHVRTEEGRVGFMLSGGLYPEPDFYNVYWRQR